MSPARDKRESWQRGEEVRPRLGHITNQRPSHLWLIMINSLLYDFSFSSFKSNVMEWSHHVSHLEWICYSDEREALNVLQVWHRKLSNITAPAPGLDSFNCWERLTVCRDTQYLSARPPALLTHYTYNTSSEVELLKRKKPAQFPGKLFVSRS